MDSLPPPTTMPTALAAAPHTHNHTASTPSSPTPTSRIPSIAETELASSPTAASPSAQQHDADADADDLPLPIPTVITSDTIPHLTDLLNRPGVRHNEQKRAWVQAKLMDAQLELKRQRRGRRQRGGLPLGGEL